LKPERRGRWFSSPNLSRGKDSSNDLIMVVERSQHSGVLRPFMPWASSHPDHTEGDTAVNLSMAESLS